MDRMGLVIISLLRAPSLLIKVDEMCTNMKKVDENSHRLCDTFFKRVSTPGFIPEVKCWKLLEFF